MKTKLIPLIIALSIMSASAQNTITKPLTNPLNANVNANGKTFSNFGGITSASDSSAAVTISLGSVNGTKIGAASDKLGFFNATPIVKPSGSVITALQNLGLISSASISFSELTGSIGSGQIANDTITYAMMQNVSATQRVIGRNTAGAGDPEEVSATQLFDWIGSTRGQINYRGASGWAGLAPGTSGLPLKSNGSGADPSYGTIAEGALNISDVTTGNASTSQHGFQKKLSGNSYDYAGGDGNYSIPSQSPLNTQNAAYTFVIGDAGKTIFHDEVTARTYTIPANGSVAYPIGTIITIVNNTSAGNITLSITTDTLRRGDGTAGTGSRTIGPDSVVVIEKTKSTEWIITGKFS